MYCEQSNNMQSVDTLPSTVAQKLLIIKYVSVPFPTGNQNLVSNLKERLFSIN